MLVLDYSADLPGAAAIKKAGYGGAVRYIGFPSRRKCTTRAELADFAAHGLGMALVYEDSATDWRGGLVRGREAGARARDHATGVGFPATRPIYMAVDQDVVTAGEFAVMVEYLRGAAQTLGGVGLTGVYGEFDVCVRVQQAGVARWFWQCRAWSGTPARLFAGRHLYQRVGTVTVGGIGCDINDVLQPDWGQHSATATVEDEDMKLTDPVDWQKINALGPNYLGHKILGAWQNSVATRATASAILAAVTSNPDVTPDQVDAALDKAVAEYMPTADEVAAAQRPFLVDLIREVLPAEQADRIVDELVSRLANHPTQED